jgi:hypothetical protein
MPARLRANDIAQGAATLRPLGIRIIDNDR